MTSKNEILDYVMNTPKNTNRAVLSSLIDNLEPAGGVGSDFPSFNIVNNTTDIFNDGNLLGFTTLSKRQEIDGEKWICMNPAVATHYVPSYDERSGSYTIGGRIASDTDKYNVTINDIPVEYYLDGYNVYNLVHGYNTNVNIVISDKK